MQDLPRALADIDKYLAIKPNYPDMWYEKARIHNVIDGNGQRGLEALNKAIAMNNKKPLYFFERAKSYYLLRDFARAKQELGIAQSMNFKGDPETVNKIMSAN